MSAVVTKFDPEFIRAGYVDVSVLGSYEVAENGDFANWKTAGRKGGGIGGAMDLAVGAKRVFIIMDHTTRDGKPRLLKNVTLPVTARGVVNLVMTNLGLLDVTSDGFVLREIAPGHTPEDVQTVSEAEIGISPNLQGGGGSELMAVSCQLTAHIERQQPSRC